MVIAVIISGLVGAAIGYAVKASEPKQVDEDAEIKRELKKAELSHVKSKARLNRAKAKKIEMEIKRETQK